MAARPGRRDRRRHAQRDRPEPPALAGSSRKNDRIDAAATACVAALQGDAKPVQPESSTDARALLHERRSDLAQASPRGQPAPRAAAGPRAGRRTARPAAAKVEQLLESVVPTGPAEITRHTLAAEVLTWGTKLKDNAKAMASLVAESGSQLTDTPGIGAVTAVRLPSRTGKPTRFPTSSAVAQYTSTAPIEIASADRARRGLMGATELGNARSVAASR